MPDSARFSLDRRLVPGEQLAAVERELRQVVDRAVGTQARSSYRISSPLRIEPCVVDLEHGLPQSFARAVKAVRRRTAGYRVTAGFTDLHYFIAGGLPGIGYGVKGEHAHGVDERVRVRDLVMTARTYAEFMLRGMEVD